MIVLKIPRPGGYWDKSGVEDKYLDKYTKEETRRTKGMSLANWITVIVFVAIVIFIVVVIVL
jgi:hypothetical protein